jgi:hypothetical protein
MDPELLGLAGTSSQRDIAAIAGLHIAVVALLSRYIGWDDDISQHK